jgi:hypothetical protein
MTALDHMLLVGDDGVTGARSRARERELVGVAP